MKHTPFYESHINSNGKIVDFGGWALPVNYGSQIKEHEAVRNDVGMFDVSHMIISDITGNQAKDFLRYLICNDVTKLEKHGIGKALYSGMLNENSGIIDDLIVYLMPFGYRIVTNAGTYEKDRAWIKNVAKNFQVTLQERRDLAMLAVQGPNAISKISELKPNLRDKLLNLKQFVAIEDGDWLYARTGYTGENGLEIMLPATSASSFWELLVKNDITPCGLGARDTLRLEAGMNLYGHDMDETINPLECGMDWVVDLNDTTRDFIGRNKYLAIKNSSASYTQVGLILEGKGILREGQKVIVNGHESGKITSGTFSPSLKLSIAIARINALTDKAFVDIRGNLEPVRVVSLPFVRNGKSLIN